MTLIPVGHREPGVCSGWAWHAAMLLVLGQVRVRLARRHRTAHMYPLPLLRPGDKGDSSPGNIPGSRAINHRQWEQQRRSLDGVGARGIAQGCLDLWHPLAPLAMDAFDIGLKATALERKIKGWEKRKDHLFFFSFFSFFFKSAEGKEDPWQRHLLGQAAEAPHSPSFPAHTVQHPSIVHPPPILPDLLAGETLPEDGISHGFGSLEHCRRRQKGKAGGGRPC